jgi:hypothetical protein
MRDLTFFSHFCFYFFFSVGGGWSEKLRQKERQLSGKRISLFLPFSFSLVHFGCCLVNEKNGANIKGERRSDDGWWGIPVGIHIEEPES